MFDWHGFFLHTAMLGTSFVLSALIGLERQARHKAAGFRTHTLVGVASCLFTLVSLYGADFNPSGRWDGSRIAAQIVSGVGFLGAGVIFLNRDVVRGLTTAASVWIVAAVGMACGASMPQIALVALLLHLLAVLLAPTMTRIIPDLSNRQILTLEYPSGHGKLRRLMKILEEWRVPFLVESTQRIADTSLTRLVISYDRPRVTAKLLRLLAEEEEITVVKVEKTGYVDE